MLKSGASPRMSSLTSLVHFLLVFPALCSATVTSEIHHYNDLSNDNNHLRYKREVTLADRSFCSSDSFWPSVRVNTTDQLQKLRTLMRSSSYGHLQAYIIPTDDEHQSENVAPYDQRRKFISGFSGSEGTAIVTLDKAAVWTDGRYFLQADEELDCNWILMKSGLPGVPTLMEWVKGELTSGNKIGSDSRLVGADTWIKWKNSLDSARIQLEEVKTNLIDKIWTKDRPPRSEDPAFVLDLKFAGKSWKDKVNEINLKLRELGADAMVVTAMDEVAWLFNLRGSDIPKSPVFRAYAVVSQEGLHLFIPPSKVTTEVKRHLSADNCHFLRTDCVRIHNYDRLINELRVMSDDWEKVLLSSRYSYSGGASYAIYNVIPDYKRIFVPSPILLLKSKKNPTEVKGMKSAHIRDAVALCDFIATLEEEVTHGKGTWDELSAASVVDGYRLQQEHNKGHSFQTISAFGSNGAIIHYRPKPATNKKIDTSNVYLLDSGGQYLDGTTDVTRTFHFGNPTEFQRETYTRVLMGQIDLAMLVFPTGTTDTTVDVVARAPLFAIGLNYRHGTGHGIGAFLYTHESPTQVRIYGKEQHKLEENQFFSDEPGYYEDGAFGIRLENIVMVVKKPTPHNFDGPFLGLEPVTFVPYEPKLIKTELLTVKQREWLNNYNAMVRTKVGEELKKQGRMKGFHWLMSKTGHINNKCSNAAIYHRNSYLLLIYTVILVSLWNYPSCT